MELTLFGGTSMKTFILITLLTCFALIQSNALAVSGKAMPSKAVTISGTLVDAYCYMKEGDMNQTHGNMKSCGTQCLKDGLPAGVVVDSKLYLLVFPGVVFTDALYLPVEVIGDLYGETDLIPAKVSVTVNGKKKNIKLAGKIMM